MSTTPHVSHASIVVRSAIYNVAFYVAILLLMLFFLPVLLMPYRATLWLARLWGRVSLWLLAVICKTKVEFRGLENIPQGPALIASKHQSFLETFSLLQHIPDFSYVLKRELTWIPFFGWLLLTAKQIGIDRGRGRNAMGQLLAQAEDFFALGRSLILFPEGTRRPVGAMPAYKSGVSYVYSAGHAPCLPVALNTGLFWPRRSFLRYPGRCVIEFLPPIATGLPREDFMRLLQNQIEDHTDALVAEAQRESPWLSADRERADESRHAAPGGAREA